MRALIILDCQKGMLNKRKTENIKQKILSVYDICKAKGDIVIATKHIDDEPSSIIFSGNSGGSLDDEILEIADYIVEKRSPNMFQNTNLTKILSEHSVAEIIITGFNAEYCCLFSTIIATDRDYKVTYIEDATDSVNTGETYEMNDLDIVDFVGCVLDWSGQVEVLYYDEFKLKN